MSPFLDINFRQGRPFAAYLHLAHQGIGAVAASRVLGQGLVLDLSAKGIPLGLEITSPGRIGAQAVVQILAEQDITIQPQDLAPLAA